MKKIKKLKIKKNGKKKSEWLFWIAVICSLALAITLTIAGVNDIIIPMWGGSIIAIIAAIGCLCGILYIIRKIYNADQW